MSAKNITKMKGKYFKSNNIVFSAPVGTVTGGTKIEVTGTITWTKAYSAAGAAYRLSGASSWTHKAGSGLTIDVTTPDLTAGETYEVALYLKRASVYDYSTIVEVTIPAADANT